MGFCIANLLPSCGVIFSQPEETGNESVYLINPTPVPHSIVYTHMRQQAELYLADRK